MPEPQSTNIATTLKRGARLIIWLEPLLLAECGNRFFLSGSSRSGF